jgi:hypothetical protein
VAEGAHQAGAMHDPIGQGNIAPQLVRHGGDRVMQY